ncbi:alpha/beta hydrolase fold domain-containing protein [Flavobacterium rhizosphaerae]|uniref:Alpha/beta hydrolase n=1 Tax=Flavobacterium rhizosphaerae TaxID=3163298 RepID=A0ABW8YZ83_9FLAO
MKNIFYIPLLFLLFLTGCNSSDDSANKNETLLAAAQYYNVPYGDDGSQVMDVYLPEGRNDEDTKVIMLIHGGAWISGDKDDFSDILPIIRTNFPNHAVVNINYRLATSSSPAFPKQIDDLQQALEFLENNDYHISTQYALLGASAGAHLAMLYSYKYDAQHHVKAVIDIVGPADFTDPAYTNHQLYGFAALNLLGTATPTPQQIEEVNPIAHVSAQSAPTLMFYGGIDPLIPATQGPNLKAALDAAGVYNEFNFYAEGGHGDWDEATMAEVAAKTTAFLQVYLQ